MFMEIGDDDVKRSPRKLVNLSTEIREIMKTIDVLRATNELMMRTNRMLAITHAQLMKNFDRTADKTDQSLLKIRERLEKFDLEEPSPSP